MTIFPENTRIGEYTTQRLIHENVFNASYLVANDAGVTFFLKAFDMDKVPEKLKVDGTVAEIANCKKIHNPTVISFGDALPFNYEGADFQCLVTPFFRGRLLSEILKSGIVFTAEEAIDLILPVMRAIEHMTREVHLCHNDITPKNILLEGIEEGYITPKIIDLGHSYEPVNGAPPFPVEDLHVHYMAPEAMKGVFTFANDVFAVTAVLYHMVTGRAPWFCDTSKREPYAIRKQKAREARNEDLVIPEDMDPKIAEVLAAGLQKDRNERADIQTLIKILDDEEKSSEAPQPQTPDAEPDRKSAVQMQKNESGKGGFKDVAGMEALKETLSQRVIWVIRDKEKAQKYRLTPPNGMLLYGPPGCGKTFFAQKFAEESGFNYMLVNGSDLGSTYVHGTQGKIADLFKEAEKNAPTVICFDEFDSFVPTRGSDSASHRADEVNEFLSQLNNCAERGLFVIGTTNRMDMIDPAVLRKGRLDLHIEIPAPDAETRKKMFEIHLKGRPQHEDLDLDRLAELTDGYASADIAFIVNEAAMVAALADERIAMRHLEGSIKSNPSSLKKEERQKIGF